MMSAENHEILPVAIDQAQWDTNPEGYLQQKATACLAVILAIDPIDFKGVDQVRAALFDIGVGAQKFYWQCNESLTYPLQRMTEDRRHGLEVSSLLDKLHQFIADIKPPKKTRPSWKERFLLLFSFRENAWQMWLDNYQTAKQQIGLLIKQLEISKQQLQRDKQILLIDQNKLLQAELLIQHDFDLVDLILSGIKLRLANDVALSQKWVNLFDQSFAEPLEKRVIELQQQLLIARQAMMTLDLMVKQNESLIRNIEQALYTSTAVLDVTANLVLVKNNQSKQDQLTGKNPVPKAQTLSAVQLKQAQTVINQALHEIETVNSIPSSHSASKD